MHAARIGRNQTGYGGLAGASRRGQAGRRKAAQRAASAGLQDTGQVAPAHRRPQLFMARKTDPVRSSARSIVAWYQSQTDVRADNGAMIRRHDGYVNDVQRFGTIIKIFEMRDRTKVRCDDEIAGTKRARDQFDRVVVFQRRAQQGVDQKGQ